nr:hypothetical protein [Methylobacterium sp. ZNC0032]
MTSTLDPETEAQLKALRDEIDPRPRIEADGELHAIATQAEDALIAQKAQIYQNGPSMVIPITEEVEAAKGRTTKVARLKPVTMPVMVDYLSRNALWLKKSRGKPKPCDPPQQAASILLSRAGEWRVNRCAGIISTPTLRPDGSILSAPGYDPATRLFLAAPPTIFPIDHKPSRQQAEAALAFLKRPLREFPFVSDADLSVALSGLITPVVRGCIKAAPMTAVNASTPGTGKSCLMDTIAAIAIGNYCPAISFGKTEEEAEKRIGTLMMYGQPLISIDNMNGVMYSDALCQYIERPQAKVRKLGESTMVDIHSTSTIYCNGNNIRIGGDLIRRTILCNLNAGVERPELREFSGNPVDEILADRARYISCALMLVKAYITAGRPDRLRPLASFEEWSDNVRSALVWLGCADPVGSMLSMRADDPVINQRQRLFATWRSVIGIGVAKAAGDIVDMAKARASDGSLVNPDLRSAIFDILKDGNEETWAHRLGGWFGRNKLIPTDGLQLVRDFDEHAKVAKWSIAAPTENGRMGE